MKSILLAMALTAQQQPCIVSDGICADTATIHPIAQKTFTASTVFVDSTTIDWSKVTPR
jgi:hypothetical protein